MLNSAFQDPAMLFSSGIMLRGTKFTFLKIEEERSLLGRTKELSCVVMKTERGQ